MCGLGEEREDEVERVFEFAYKFGFGSSYFIFGVENGCGSGDEGGGFREEVKNFCKLLGLKDMVQCTNNWIMQRWR